MADDWFEGNPASLMEALRRAQEALSQDDIVERTAKALHGQLVSVAQSPNARLLARTCSGKRAQAKECISGLYRSRSNTSRREIMAYHPLGFGSGI